MSNSNGQRKPVKNTRQKRPAKAVEDDPQDKKGLSRLTRGVLTVAFFTLLGAAVYVFQTQKAEAEEITEPVPEVVSEVQDSSELSWRERVEYAKDILSGGNLDKLIDRLDEDLAARENQLVIDLQAIRNKEEVLIAMDEDVSQQAEAFDQRVAGFAACLEKYLED